MNNPICNGMYGIQVAIIEAIAIGLRDRDAASLSRAAEDAHRSGTSRAISEIPVRVASVIGDVPNKVLKAVSTTGKTADRKVRVPVMELTSLEYPGAIPRRLDLAPTESLSVDQLRHAGRCAFDELKSINLHPELGYHYNGDTRTYSLQIFITVST